MAFNEPRKCSLKCGFPHVTQILSILSKPALLPWGIREERRKFKAAMLEVLTRPEPQETTPDAIWQAVEAAVEGISEAERLAKEATDIGTAAHALIANELRVRLGRPSEPMEPPSEASLRAFEAFLAWAESVDFQPREIEFHVQSQEYGYAGWCDCYALVNDIPSILDFKSSKRIWPEAFLQVRGYQEAARSQGMDAEQGVIVRLPKVVEDPGVEAVIVPADCTTEDFVACLSAYRWQKRMETSLAVPV